MRDFRKMRNPGQKHHRKSHSTMEVDFPMGYVFVWCTSRSGHNFIINNIYSWLGDPDRKQRRYVNGEDSWPDRLYTVVNWNAFNRSPGSIKIILIRDLLNWFASKVYRKRLHDKPKDVEMKAIRADIQRWKKIANYYFSDLHPLMSGAYKINYDEFVISEDYRRKICSEIGGTYNEDYLHIVTKEGGGSSFTGLNQINGNYTDVINRYKKLEGLDEVVSLLFEDPEVLYLYLDNFDVSKEKDDFLERQMFKSTDWGNP